MAKIYETREDIERERLAAEASKGHTKAPLEFTAGILNTLVATNETLAQRGRLQEKAFETPGTLKISKSLGWLGSAFFGTAAIVSFVAAFLDHRKAKKADAKLDRLGPQTMVVPDSMAEAGLLHESSMPLPITADTNYTTLTQHAERLQKSRTAEPAQSAVKS